MKPKQKRVLSLIQPSGIPTLGNYLGALKNWSAYRWIIRKTNKFGGTAAYAPAMQFFDGEETTGIMNVNDNDNDNESSWYSLDGMKLFEKPTQKGVYIHNGKKVVIK